MNTKKISIALSSFILGITAFIAVLKLNISQNYPDFIVGSIAWSAEAKIQDLFIWPVFIFTLFFSYIFLSKAINITTDRYGDNISSNLINKLILWSLPFYIGIGNIFLTGKLNETPIIISAIGIIFISAVAFLYKHPSEKLDPNFVSNILLVILLVSIIPLEIVILINRFLDISFGDLSFNTYITINLLICIIGIILGIYSILPPQKNNLKIHFSKILLIVQLGLPFFFLTLYPAKLLQQSGGLFQYQTTIYFKILIAILIIAGLYSVAIRFIKYSQENDWKKLFSPIAFFGLLIALKAGNTILPHISADDYHFGESLLGWWSYVHGAIPYIDYIPAHGIIDDDFPLFLSSIFYDGTAASLGEAKRLAFAILGLIAFISIHRFTGSILISFIIILLLAGSRLSWFFIIPFICLWINPSLKNNPTKWLIIWGLTAPIVILGVPPQGSLLVAAFGVLAIKLCWEQIRTGNKSSWLQLGICYLGILSLFLITPLYSMLLGALRYVLENGPINQLAYGVPWSFSWQTKRINSGLVFESIRMLWVIVPIICLHIIWKTKKELKDSTSSFYIAIIFLIFSLLLIPYSMGRIDPGSISRAGAASILCWVILFPLLILTWQKFKINALNILLFTFIAALLGAGSNVSFSNLTSTTVAKISVPNLQDTAKLGLPNIGTAIIGKEHLNRIQNLNILLKSRLEDNESYLDLSSRNAHYFYVNRLPLLPISALYNLAPPIQQKRALNILQPLPKIALLQADNITQDGGGLALRTPYIYKFIINNYIPRFEYGFIVGYRKSENDSNSIITAEIKNFTDRNWNYGFNKREAAIILSDSVLVSMLKIGDQIKFSNGDTRTIERMSTEAVWLSGESISPIKGDSQHLVEVIVSPQTQQEYTASLFYRAFSISDFRKIPISWGRSLTSLKEKMSLIENISKISPSYYHLEKDEQANYVITGKDPQITFDVSGTKLSGQNSSLLKFDFKCIDQKTLPKIQIFWWGDYRNNPFENSSVKFSAENGTLIVPLDASPWWLTLHKIKGIRIDLDNINACRAFNIQNVELYQRK